MCLAGSVTSVQRAARGRHPRLAPSPVPHLGGTGCLAPGRDAADPDLDLCLSPGPRHDRHPHPRDPVIRGGETFTGQWVM